MKKNRKVALPNEACPECGATLEVRRGPLSQLVNGEEIVVPDIQYMECPACGEQLTDTENTTQLYYKALEIYRRQHDLLSPKDVRDLRAKYGLTPGGLAQLLRMRPDEVTRWEDGKRVQTPVLDLVLRLLRDIPGSFDLARGRAA